jgi:DNA polymerase/3'-5' exonuclease PolX
MTASKKTALQIRNLLRITKKYAVIGENEFRSNAARKYLHANYYDDSTLNIIDNGSHYLIWN